MNIPQPRNSRGLKWSMGFSGRWTAKFTKAQKFVDSECLRYSDPLTPRQTGYLINSGRLGSKIGSGLLRYLASYAATQYYNTPQTRGYDPNRGSQWFERMKTAYKKTILAGAKKLM